MIAAATKWLNGKLDRGDDVLGVDLKQMAGPRHDQSAGIQSSGCEKVRSSHSNLYVTGGVGDDTGGQVGTINIKRTGVLLGGGYHSSQSDVGFGDRNSHLGTTGIDHRNDKPNRTASCSIPRLLAEIQRVRRLTKEVEVDVRGEV